jgi:hypothetical protein
VVASSSSAGCGGGERRDGSVCPPQPCCLVALAPLVLTHDAEGPPGVASGELLRWEAAVETTLDRGCTNKCAVAPSSANPMSLLSFWPVGVARGRRILSWCCADLGDGIVNATLLALGCSSSSWPAMEARERAIITQSCRVGVVLESFRLTIPTRCVSHLN